LNDSIPVYNRALRTAYPSAYVDLNHTMQDPTDTTVLFQAYDGGDGVHPSQQGHTIMAECLLSYPNLPFVHKDVNFDGFLPLTGTRNNNQIFATQSQVKVMSSNSSSFTGFSHTQDMIAQTNLTGGIMRNIFSMRSTGTFNMGTAYGLVGDYQQVSTNITGTGIGLVGTNNYSSTGLVRRSAGLLTTITSSAAANVGAQYGMYVSMPSVGASSLTGDSLVGFMMDDMSLSSCVNPILGTINNGTFTEKWNMKLHGTRGTSGKSYIGNALGIGFDREPTLNSQITSLLHLGKGTSAISALRLTPQARVASPNDGDFYLDSLTNNYITRTNGATMSTVLNNFVLGQTLAANNTVTETNILGNVQVGQSKTLPANFFNLGKTVTFVITGHFAHTVAGPTINFRFKIGSTTYCTTGAIATTLLAVTNKSWKAEVIVTCRSIGAGGTLFVQGTVLMDDGTTYRILGMPNSAAIAYNTTTANAVEFTAQWGTADPSNTISATNSYLDTRW